MTADEARRIHERLDALREEVASVNGNVIAMGATLEAHAEKVDRLDDVVHGNGRDGLRTDVVTLKARAASEQDDLKRLRRSQERAGRWQRGQLAVVILGLLGFLGMASKYFFT